MVTEEAPYFYVEDGKLVSPCSFYVYNGDYDEMLMGVATFSFIGGEAEKEGGEGIASQTLGRDGIYVADGVVYVDNTDGSVVYVYDLQGVKVAEAAGASVQVGNLKPGIYVVKAGGRTAKVAVR